MTPPAEEGRPLVAWKLLRLGGLSLLAASLVYMIGEAVAARAWATPAYSYIGNWVSDLGVPGPTTFQGRAIDSPLHAVFSAGLIVEGTLFLVAAILLASSLGWVRARPFVALVTVHAAGVTIVALVPETAGSLHVAGALLAIGGGNIATLLGCRMLEPVMPGWLPKASLILGIAGLTNLVLLGVLGLVSADLLAAIGGLIERLSIYAVLVWAVLVGLLAVLPRPHRVEAVQTAS